MGSTTQTEPRRQRIPTLDGWRGVAILLVLLDHGQTAIFHRFVSPWLDTIGQHGVAIFFVLSGFLITQLLLEEQARTGSVDLIAFYIRRCFRLMPAAWAYLEVVVILTLFAHTFSSRELLASLFFFRNFVDPTGQHPLTGHFWSLSIEEQFYMVWPAALLILRPRRALQLSILGLAAVALWRYIHWSELSRIPVQGTFATQYRADALLVGCVLALTLPFFKRYLRTWQALPLMGCLLYYVANYHKLIPLTEVVVIALLIAITSQYPRSVGGRILTSKPLATAGLYSYSIYIWFQIPMRVPGLGVWAKLLFIPVAVFSMAWLNRTFIEVPMIARGHRIAGQRAKRAITPTVNQEASFSTLG